MSGHWLDRPANIRRLWRGFLLTLGALVAAELGIALHPHFAVEATFAFHAWYGLLACAAMIGVAKVLGMLLKRPDDYYRHERSHD
jgi:hypothetical protein